MPTGITKEIKIPSYVSIKADDYRTLVIALDRIGLLRDYLRETEYVRDEVVKLLVGYPHV